MHCTTFLRRAATLLCSAALGSLLFPASLSAQSHGQSKGKPAEVGKLFQSQCMSCHLPPDPGFPTDRAWLNQIQDTA